MKVQTSDLHSGSRHGYQFCFPKLDTLVRVEESEDGVIVHATRDSFSERRKIFFIRELAAEGFISGAYQWFAGFGEWSSLPVRWRVDYSWLKLEEQDCQRPNRFMIRLVAYSVLLWLTLMGAVLYEL